MRLLYRRPRLKFFGYRTDFCHVGPYGIIISVIASGNPFFLAVLIFSVILHEVARLHGRVARRSDRAHGRQTHAQPINHIDPIGSIILPAAPFSQQFTHFPFLIGYASRCRTIRTTCAASTAKGWWLCRPATNIFLAVVFVCLSALAAPAGAGPIIAFGTIVYINMLLALFNLLPIPPLDGSKCFLRCSAGSHRARAGYDTFRLNFERLGAFPARSYISVLLLSGAVFSVFSSNCSVFDRAAI